MGEMASVDITEDEAQLYDRQIRLWGLESQKRLRKARVLVIGARGFGAEVFPRSEIGKNRAEASLERAQELNPMVEITADKEKIDDKPDSFFGNFDVVCATECTTAQFLHLDNVCRENNIKFFCGDVYGFFGYIFLDLQIQEFMEEVTTITNTHEPTGEPLAKKRKTEKTVQNTKGTETYVPLQDALDVDWTSESYAKRLKRMDPSYFVMKALLKFCDKKGRKPSPSEREKDIESLKEFVKEELTKQKIREDFVPELLLKDVFAEISPVCAIMGGITAQEIIKTVSQKERPHNNIFFFNPLKCIGYSACFGV
ncbi:hypothetical protein R5R35_006333 [Gryllus longicercus]|uniref:THIF-type NAD/FAD binding fold domain-containing protein n=1 Tax=Gryllus longicercus TaxID=2509291 RepID=A0AAN9VX15_9ORTH